MASTSTPELRLTTPHDPVDLFYVYSHTDESLRNELEKHLTILKRQGVISNWHDRRIGAGTEWESQIHERLDAAHLILLLVSVDFLASDYCYNVEMIRAMQRHEAREARVLPIILRACDWKGAPFGKLQALPRDGVPVTSPSWPNLDEAFLNVEQGIRQAVEELTVPTITTAEPITPPHIFIGNAQISGLTAAYERVTAYIDEVEAGASLVRLDGYYTLRVNGTTGSRVTFLIGTRPAQETARLVAGGVNILNLSTTAGPARDPRLEILKVLRPQDEDGHRFVALDELAKTMELYEQQVRRACDALEGAGHVKSLHTAGGDLNPSYFITEMGKLFLFNEEFQ